MSDSEEEINGFIVHKGGLEDMEPGVTYSRLDDEIRGMTITDNFAEELRAIPIGEYLRVWGKFDNITMGDQCEQGELSRVDIGAGKIYLKSTTYNRTNEVSIGKISWIEKGHTV
ncbi:hypothetical protein NVV94_07990 [Pseudomonas sp. LS1212]|uniref:hypothetical protein n=1 Tax=Pseudomonas sp. LS1212 TaxID=2972478 RepID=UPI00215C1A90|nr:hypothetical protein [Pseudomonas sp. LS1212]UVJ45486.1 hypothetical protein NVV94_07990 [Pseudomonas sp. LS1212]